MEGMQKPGYEYFFPEYPQKQIRFLQERIGRLHIKERDEPVMTLPWCSDRFDKEKPKYPDDIDMVFSPKPIKKGQKFDVIGLLSTYGKNKLVCSRNGDQVNVESLRGKYIMLCCFLVPFHWCSYDACYLRDLALLSDELSVRDDFEMVVVAKMRHDWANDEQAFDRFISGFSCLAVPFRESKCRDYICGSLKLGDSLECLLVDPRRKVLQVNSMFYSNIGGDAFPFTVEKVRSVSHDYVHPRERLSLEGLLGCKCNPSDYTLYKNPGGGSESIRVSELKEKVVGLYLCTEGLDILKLWEVYQQCRNKGLGFEIVLVYIPCTGLLTQKLLQDFISDFLQKHEISWWVLPFNYSVSRRLYELCGLYYDDGLIIVGPRDEYVDLRGAGVLLSFGVDAYPFTREHLVQKELQRKKGLTLKSVLDVGSQSCEFLRINCDDISEKRVVHLADLHGKNVLLYLYYSRDPELYAELAEWYKYIMKNHRTDFEVVVVHIGPKVALKSGDDKYNPFSNISEPWLVCPVNISQSGLVPKRLFHAGRANECLVAFGEDGKICSIRGHKFLSSRGTDPLPFVADMRKEVIAEFTSDGHRFMNDMLH